MQNVEVEIMPGITITVDPSKCQIEQAFSFAPEQTESDAWIVVLNLEFIDILANKPMPSEVKNIVRIRF